MMKRHKLSRVSIFLFGLALLGSMAQTPGWLSGIGVRINSGGWYLSATGDPASDAKATAAPKGSVYGRTDTGHLYSKTGAATTTTWVDLSAGGGGAALSAITAATGSNTIANGNNHSQIWNWALTSNSVAALT